MLIACALDALLTHTGWTASPSSATLAFDGGVYDKFPEYRAMLGDALRDMLGATASCWVCCVLAVCAYLSRL